MYNAIIQAYLDEQEINQLTKEFPQINFIHFPKLAIVDIPDKSWQNTEILFGERLTEQNLILATDLRWIHTPTSSMQRLCLKEIEQKGNILISYTPETNTPQIGEYVLAAVGAFAKNLFHWKAADQFPMLLWDCKWRNNMWSLKDKVFLQIGLGKAGLSIANRAKLAEMIVWGVDELPSVQPFCDKNYSLRELHDLLPKADIVSVTIPYGNESIDCKLGKKELELMKHDSILSILATKRHIDEEALYECSKDGKFRGLLIDAYFHSAISTQSKLWQIPNLLLTPGVAPRPKKPDREAFKLFRYNLRQFVSGNYSDMQNLVDPSLVADLL